MRYAQWVLLLASRLLKESCQICSPIVRKSSSMVLRWNHLILQRYRPLFFSVIEKLDRGRLLKDGYSRAWLFESLMKWDYTSTLLIRKVLTTPGLTEKFCGGHTGRLS